MAIPNSKEIVIQDESGVFNTVWFKFFEEINRKTRLDTPIKLGGLINVDTTSIANSSTTQTNLISYDLPANSLKTTGDIIEIDSWGSYEANANNKQITLEFGSQTIFDTGAIAANDGDWRIKAKIIRKTATTQEIIVDFISSNTTASYSAIRTAGTQTLTNDITIKTTGQGSADNDIVNYGLTINLILNS